MKFPQFARICLLMLTGLTVVFLGRLAIAEPVCTNCSIMLVKWALPRAEILTAGWLVAGGGYLWFIREILVGFARRIRPRRRADSVIS